MILRISCRRSWAGEVGELLVHELVVLGLEQRGDVVDDARREDAFALVVGPLLEEHAARLDAARRQDGQALEELLVGEDVALDVEVVGELERAVVLEEREVALEGPVGGHGDAGQGQVDHGAAVGAADLDRLAAAPLVGEVRGVGGIDLPAQVGGVGPAERDADQGAAVEVAPADPGRRLLVRDQAEVGRGDRVAEGGQGVGVLAQAADELAGLDRELPVGAAHGVAAVLLELQVEVEAAAGHPLLELGRERGHGAVAEGDVADDPAAEDEVVGGLLDRPGQELDLELLGQAAGDLGDVAADAVDDAVLVVGVLDRPRHPGDVGDHLVEDRAALGERGRAVVAAVGLDGIGPVGGVGQQEELELAQGVDLETGRLAEHRGGPGQDAVGREGGRRAVRGEVAADEVEAALVEGIEEGRSVLGDDVEVREGHVDHALEERRAVDALAFGQDGLEVVAVGRGDGQLLELAVDGQVVEGDPLDALRLDDLEQVGPGEVGGRLVEQERQRVGQGVTGALRRHLVTLLYG